MHRAVPIVAFTHVGGTEFHRFDVAPNVIRMTNRLPNLRYLKCLQVTQIVDIISCRLISNYNIYLRHAEKTNSFIIGHSSKWQGSRELLTKWPITITITITITGF
jgi:hypothetical protein